MSSLFFEKCLLGSGLNVIFRWLAQTFILLKSLFKLVVDKFILSTTEKSKIPSAKSLTFVVVRPRKDPCTPDSILHHEDS